MTPSSLHRLALAGMVAFLLGAAACAETPEPAQGDSSEATRTRANAGGGGALTDENFFTAVALWFSDEGTATSTYGHISNWDVSAVTDMEDAFDGQSSFNGDISSWDVSSVTGMGRMFFDAASFNQDLSGWCVTNIASEPGDFDEGADSWVLTRPVWGTCP